MSTPIKRENSGSESADEVVNDPNAAAAMAFSQPQRPKFQISRHSASQIDRRYSMIAPGYAANSPDKVTLPIYELDKRSSSVSNQSMNIQCDDNSPNFRTIAARSSPTIDTNIPYGSLRSEPQISQSFNESPEMEEEQPAQDRLDLDDIASPFWIDCLSPTLIEMNDISKLFHLHPLTNEDIQTSDTREKCEVFEKYFFVVVRSFEQDQYKNSFMQPITVSIFQYSPTFHSRNVRSRIDQLSAYGLHVTTEWINYALIDDITDSYMPFMKVIELEVDTIEELVLILAQESEQSDMLRRIGIVRKRVMQLLRLMNTKADVIKMIINRCLDTSIGNETRFYLEDIHDHVLTMMQNLSHYEKSLARSHSNYLAQISIDITQASNRTSDTVMRMTLLASILVPLNIITGLWGMNVRVPGQDRDDLTWFFSIICTMFFLITGTYYFVRRMKLV
ncbi:CorA metal ion transporter [Boothiomyces macroporosus]|uniref:CorA metal ion transporter n=1 Tax=Boothiomyces macroporosus TaxID=261099 RepID=A0AAD5UJF8_9FUNG|nr:CorA metal ion transporter [Boothiomyces macroporosus]